MTVEVGSSVLADIVANLIGSVIELRVLKPCNSHVSLKVVDLLNVLRNLINFSEVKSVRINRLLGFDLGEDKLSLMLNCPLGCCNLILKVCLRSHLRR